MTEEQGFEILERIAAVYTQFDLNEKRIEVWLEQLLKMPYERVLKNLNHHISTNRFPPSIADIAAEAQQENLFLEQKKNWESQVLAQRKSGDFKTFIDFLPEALKEKYAHLIQEGE